MIGTVAPPKPAPPPWPDQRALKDALALFKAGLALVEAPNPTLAAPRPTPALRELMDQIHGYYVLRVECDSNHCRGPLGRWQLNTLTGIAVEWYRPNRLEDRTSAPRPSTAAASLNKGHRSGYATHDADGTYTARCSKCGRKLGFGVEYRTRLFLQALHDHQQVILA